MITEVRKSFRKEIFSKLEEQFQRGRTPEDDLFYCHSSEDRIVLSHALFWVMTRNLRGEPTLKSKACLKCLYFTIIIFDLCRYLEYFSYLYTINQTE